MYTTLAGGSEEKGGRLPGVLLGWQVEKMGSYWSDQVNPTGSRKTSTKPALREGLKPGRPWSRRITARPGNKGLETEGDLYASLGRRRGGGAQRETTR